MGILGGLDLGHGSQAKLIRTNFLCTTISAECTSQALANFLTLANNRLPKLVKCDYITVLNSGGGVSLTIPSGNRAFSTEHGVVAMGFSAATAGAANTHAHETNMALMGPSVASLAVKSAAPAHADSFSDVQTKSNGKILALTGLAAIKLSAVASTDSFGGFTEIDLNAGTNDETQLDFSNAATLVKQLSEGNLSSADLSKPLSSIRSGGISTTDFTVAGLNDGFVAEGNRSGLTPTTFTTLGADIDSKVFGILSVTALVRDAE